PRAWAQLAECGVTMSTPLRVEDATGVDTLRAAANCTGGGSLKADWAGPITLDTPISIASGMFLSITGKDTLAEVRGGSQTRMFEVSRGGGLILTQLKLSGGTAGSGGAIYSDAAALVLESCIFHGNVATDGDGGAVWADGGNVTIVGGEFLDNTATVYGGAVAATGVSSLVVAEGSTFEGNKALVGGALYCSAVAVSGLASSATSCSLNSTLFTSNTATRETEDQLFFDFSDGVDGGGAVAFLSDIANVTDSVFGSNHAEHSGGALLGGNSTDITINGCKFENNTAEMYGGAIAASSMTLGGGTRLTNNTAISGGGAVFGWDSSGKIIFDDIWCAQNSAIEYGGCFYIAGSGIVNNGTAMHDNEAAIGGCIYAHDGCDVNVVGGDFMCHSTRRGGFLAIGDRASVKITGGLIANNVAERRAGAIHCGDEEGSTLTIEGGTFRDNIARESGGMLAARASSTVVEITGGVFSNNTAKFYGGSMFLHDGASLKCEGVTIRENYAGDQGGGLYARDSTWVNSSCDWIGNESPQGAALYLTNVDSAMLKNHAITDNLAFSGSVLYITESSVLVSGVTFKSEVGLKDDSSNRAVQSDSKSRLTLNECVFDGWLGDTVIYHRNPDPSSLFLDSCDFSASFASMAVFSLNSDAKIRNAVVGDNAFTNDGTLSSSLALVNRVLDCSSPNVCGPGKCVDSMLGVLCECLDVDTCLDDGGRISLALKTYQGNETYSPDPVSFELVVSSAGDGTTYAIWDLEFESEDLELDVSPSSGILPPGGNVTVAVTGTPSGQDVGGDLVSIFYLTFVGSASSNSTAGARLEVESTFYLCSAYEYALPLANETNGVSCEQCIFIEGREGVNCDSPGATLASLPIRQGYWRSSRESLVVHECFHSKACVGATEVSSADEYCRDGYQGPYCAVCAEGYGRGVSNTCHSCDKTKGQLLIAAGALSSVVVILLLFLAVVFLVGGLDAVDAVHKSVTRNVSRAGKASKLWSLPKTSLQERYYPERGSRTEHSNGTIAPALDFNWELQRCASERDADQSSRASPSTCPGPDVTEKEHTRPGVVGVTTAAGLPDVPEGYDSDAGMSVSHHARTSTEEGAGVGRVLVNERAGVEAKGSGRLKCCGLGNTIKRWASRVPLDKFKILVVIWQILTVFSSITGVEFPASYATFLSWINVVNLDIGQIFSASCVLPPVNFYTRLLVATLTPLVLAAGLLLTYQMAKHRAAIGSAGVVARRAAWSRHVAAGLLLTFLVFTSVSTLVFETFDCDDAVDDGKTYLRADYSLSCKSKVHSLFQGYALLMILVYPVGIPALYAAILWKNRELLNPRVNTVVASEPGEIDEAAPREELTKGAEFKERVNARREHPDLVPSMFLWKDFGPDWFYYEVIECGRRMLLTGVLVFVAPHGWKQAFTACIFAFVILLGFEVMRPHADPTDVWLYRLGCVVIFLSNFLALLIEVDAAGEDNRSALGGLLVAINVLLAITVFVASCFTARQSVDDSPDEENSFNLAKVMLTAEQDATEIIRLARAEHAMIPT
ncbi:unnamed protein product, partial [Laminaria digitata]